MNAILERRQSDPLGEIVEFAGKHGAGLYLVKKEPCAILQLLAPDEFGRVATGEKVGRGRGADDHDYVRLVHRLGDFLRFEPRWGVDEGDGAGEA